MKNVIVFSTDIFFIKNIKEYIKTKNLKVELFLFSNLSKKNILKIKRLVKYNQFTIINIGLSGSIQFNIKNGPKIYEFNTGLYYNLLTGLEKLSLKKVFFISASCAYPSNKKILKEIDYGYPPIEETNFFYSLSKIFATNICNNINKNKKFNYMTLVPATLYGQHSNYHKINSHVLIALLNKLNTKKKRIVLWGSGKPKREFIHIEDFINAIFFIDRLNIKKNIINVGSGVDLSIRELAYKIRKLVNFNGKIIWDKSKKDGSLKKLLDSSYLHNKGWKPEKNLDNSLEQILLSKS